MRGRAAILYGITPRPESGRLAAARDANDNEKRRDSYMTHEVAVGQKYRQVALPQDVWQVVLVLSNSGPIPHARLAKIGSKDVKTISFPALLDRKLYQFVA